MYPGFNVGQNALLILWRQALTVLAQFGELNECSDRFGRTRECHVY